MSNNINVVPIRMKQNTIDQVSKIQASVNAPSRSDAVRRAIEISELLINNLQHGNKILIETKDGKQQQILIAGLTK